MRKASRYSEPGAVAVEIHQSISSKTEMKLLVAIFVLLIVSVTAYGQARTKPAIELTRDSPSTLISTNSSDYTVFGLKLGMSPTQARRVLKQNKRLVGVRDRASRIYVYDKGPGGAKGKAVLYLIWEPDGTKLGRITVFNDCAKYLKPNFARLLTFDGLSDSSVFRKAFIGDSNRSDVTLDVPSIDLKNTTYYYDKIGLEVTLVHLHSKEEHVVFALVAKQSK